MKPEGTPCKPVSYPSGSPLNISLCSISSCFLLTGLLSSGCGVALETAKQSLTTPPWGKKRSRRTLLLPERRQGPVSTETASGCSAAPVQRQGHGHNALTGVLRWERIHRFRKELGLFLPKRLPPPLCPIWERESAKPRSLETSSLLGFRFLADGPVLTPVLPFLWLSPTLPGNPACLDVSLSAVPALTMFSSQSTFQAAIAVTFLKFTLTWVMPLLRAPLVQQKI